MLSTLRKTLSSLGNGYCSDLRNPLADFTRYCNCSLRSGYSSLLSWSSAEPRPNRPNVAIFWDLDNKPPNSFPPFEAATKLKVMASSFGSVRHMVAYANSHSFSYVPRVVRERRKERKLVNQLESKGVIRPSEPYLCHVCSRKFSTNDKLINHFRQIHEREHKKRLSQIESARGKRRINLVAKYTMKMDRYRNAARDILTPRVGYGLADELKQAGFWVQTVSDRPQAADIALRNHMIDMMDHRRADCLVLVSDDSGFEGILKEARLRCLKTVVVGDISDGTLKRTADVGFSWKEILMGNAKKGAESVLGRRKDRGILKRSEWKYDSEVEKERYQFYYETDEDVIRDIEGTESGMDARVDDARGWWELDSDPDIPSAESSQ